ncbi:AprI/Inh family metalloprotease inhibitor [Oharaeibacter diazotrophicus]|uniref:Protease inhibitor Inh n=1 Tax=Oharaeibacter diazotrophicus TaxID=1920512 RepID=A0A4R6RKH8_9HYPH|nr:AprI/Inh family metalloprotease inhibitor [Oharaeibacter diazotrophicus]TDP86447.1 protease inhibitor Inh [Oharaeibacter diazotrophicus]BBE71611.1 hypothetical protein OHA_1_01189 [Pleomorphomonas sp. SM30]GLS78373.1 hypothetical protein GCM10007904_37100 [Oharaeibacter diazotrophicus]
MTSAVRLSILVATLALAGCQTEPAPYDPYRPPVRRNDPPPVYVQPPRDQYRPPVQPNNPYRPGPNDGYQGGGYQGDGYVRGGTPNQPGSLYAGGGDGYVRGGEPGSPGSLYGNGGRNDPPRNDGGFVNGGRNDGGRNDGPGAGREPAAPRLGGAWRLMTTGSGVNCSIRLSPGEGGTGSVSAPANCYSYTHLKSYEMRGRDLVLVDAFGGTVNLQPSGGYWQGRGRDGEGVILQR